MGWRATILIVAATVGWASTRQAPIRYDVTSLMQSDASTLQLIGGGSVKLPEVTFSKVFFIDENPGANWEHPARLEFFQGPKMVAEIRVTRAPRGLTKRFRLAPPLADDLPTFKISNFDGKYRLKNPSSYHALLLNGNGDDRHWNDFSYLYRVLTSVYGYFPENIYVADSNYKDSQADLDGNGTADIRHGSTLLEIRTLVETLKTRITRGDQLLLVVNDHGSIKDGESTVILHDAEMKASEFATLLNTIPAERILSIFEQCFSGGFVRPTVAKGRVSIAASTNTEISWASEDGVFDEFLYLLTSAFAHQRHDGTPVNADTDGNGRVTAREAYSFAVSRDLSWESPFMEASKNAPSAFTLGLD